MSPEESRSLLDRYMQACPVVAILRGLAPHQAIEVGETLYDAGLRIMEVPLNSPDPLVSITRLAEHFADRALIGAGTVLSVEQAEAVREAGGKLIVSPNMNVDVISRTKKLGMISLPGCFTATEAFAALDAGADGLKLFPGEAVTTSVVKALRAVLPKETRLLVVGGIGAHNMAEYVSVGTNGFGIGSWLYKDDRDIAEIGERARQLTTACTGV